MNKSGFKPSERGYTAAQRISYRLLVIILFIYGLIAIRNFLYPIAFGFLFAYLLFPFVKWLEKKRLPRILAIAISLISAVLIIVTIIIIAYQNIVPFVGKLPELAENGINTISDILARIAEKFGIDRAKAQEMVRTQTSSILERGNQLFAALFTATTNTFVSIGLIPIFIFLFLYYRTKFMYFLLKIAGKQYRWHMLSILREISTVMVRYVAGIIIVVIILSVINSFGIWIIGSRYPIPLGIASALFNFIPYIGTLIGGLVPLLFALIIEGDLVLVLRVVILFIIIQFIENNILTPNIVGGNVQINPFFIITGIFAASMVWGVPGMLLIVPFLAILRIVFSHMPLMKPYAFLLGEEGTSRHSITLSKIKSRWNKLINKN
jgi:predicted PurR-regulated permease PerM